MRWHRWATCALLLPTVLVVGVPTVAGGADLSGLVVSDPPEGYELSNDPTHPNGNYTLEELLAVLGGELVGFERVMAKVPAYGRSWQDTTAGAVLVLLLFETRSARDAAEFTDGASESSAADAATSFDPGLVGAEGFSSEADGVSLHMVVWQQGPYAVQILSASLDETEGAEAARDVARRQSVLLFQSRGVSVGVVPESDDDDNSVAYQLGRMTGSVACLGVIGLIIFGVVRRSRAKRAADEWSPQSLAYPPPAGSTGPQPPPPPYSG